MYKILIIHSHNANRGDEAAVKALTDELLANNIEKRIVISNNGYTKYPQMDSRVSQIDRFPKLASKIDQLEFLASMLTKGKFIFTQQGKIFFDELKKSEIVIHAPGGPSIGDIYYDAELLYLLRLDLIRRMGIPYMFYSPSMGPFKDKRREKLRKRVLMGAQFVFVRDPISYKYVKEFVPDVGVKLAMDSALQHDIDVKKYGAIYDQYTELKDFVEGHKKCVGITITDLKWHPTHGKTEISIKINEVFQKFVDTLTSKGYGVVFIPQLYGISDDATYMSGFVKPKYTFVVNSTEDKYDAYFQQYVIGRLYAVVGMRYHSNIFSAKMGTPFVSVSYEQKMRGFMDSTGLSEYCIDLKALTYDTLVGRFNQMEATHDAYAQKLKELHEPMKKKAYEPTQVVLDFLESRHKMS